MVKRAHDHRLPPNELDVLVRRRKRRALNGRRPAVRDRALARQAGEPVSGPRTQLRRLVEIDLLLTPLRAPAVELGPDKGALSRSDALEMRLSRQEVPGRRAKRATVFALPAHTGLATAAGNLPAAKVLCFRVRDIELA